MPGYGENELARINERMLAQEFHARCGFGLIAQSPGEARCSLPVDENTDGGGGYLHGAILYASLEAAAFFAVMPLVPRGHWVRTHTASFNLLRPAPTGAQVELQGVVDKCGRTTAFISVRASIVAEGEAPRLIATGQLVKTIVTVPADWAKGA